MSYPTWPATLPRPERSSYQLQPQDGRRKRGFEAGPPGYRRRFSSVAQMVTLAIVCDSYQRQTFWTFYETGCAGGASLFWMPDPTRDGWPVLTSAGVPLLDAAGDPVIASAIWLCTWGDAPPIEMVDGLEFQLQFAVVVMP